MNPKYLELINYLIQYHDYLSTKNISNELGLSVRTIRNYISEINYFHPALIYSSHKGYKINHKYALSIMKKVSDNQVTPQDSNDRVNYIICRLTTKHSPNEMITTYDLEDELFISSTTLNNDLKKVTSILLKYDVSLVKNKNNLSIQGLEKNKRKVIIDLVYLAKKNFISLEKLQDIFPKYDIELIHEIITQVLYKYRYFCNDYSLFSIILHIIVSIERIQNNHAFSFGESSINGDASEYLLAKEVASEIKKAYSISYPEQEIYELSLLLRSRISKYEFKSMDASNLISEIGTNIYQLTKELIEEVNNTYFVDLQDEDLIIKFALHINNLLIRSTNDYLNRTPLNNSIEQQYPLLYEIALFIANRLQKIKKIKINRGEITYIALHIGAILEEKRMEENKISCIIYSPQYYDQNSFIFKKIKENVPNLLIKDTLANESIIPKYSDIDFIISTVDITQNHLDKPVKIITPFVNATDINQINSLVSKNILEKKQNKLKIALEEFMDEKLFYLNSKYTSKDEIIHFITNIFNQLNYTNENFYDEVIEREKLNSTAFGNIAIPHSLKMTAKKTGIFIFITNKPIQWENNKVNLVVMLAINKNDSNHFKDIYENLTLFLSESSNLEKTMCCKCYQEFIDMLVTFNVNVDGFV